MEELLTRDAILAADDIITEVVPVPEWGGAVKVRGLTGTDRDAFEASMVKGKGKMVSQDFSDLRAKLCALAIVGPDNTPLFTMADVKKLGAKSSLALNRVYEVAAR